MNNKISFFFILCIAISIISGYSFDAGAAAGSYSDGFESYGLHTQVSSSWLTTVSQHQTNYVDNTNPHTDTKHYYSATSGVYFSSWWNYSYDSSDEIVLWECTFRSYFADPGAVVDFYFYDSDGHLLVNIDMIFETNSIQVRYKDHNNATNDLGNNLAFNTYYHFGFYWNNTEEINYYVGNYPTGTFYQVTDSPCYLKQNPRIANLNIKSGSSGNAKNLYIDNHNITVDQVGDWVYGGGQLEPFDGMTAICTNHGGKTMTTKATFNDYLEVNIYSSIVGTLQGFDLFVDTAQYNGDPDLDNYELYLNGILVGNPNQWIVHDSNTYKLRWYDALIDMNYDELLAEIRHIGGWFVKINNKPIGMTIGSTYYGGAWSSNYGNGIIDGFELQPTSQTFSCCFYYTSGYVEPDCTGSDTLIVSDNNVVTGDTVNIAWDLSTKQTLTTLNISVVGKDITGGYLDNNYQDFIILQDCKDSVGYTPMVTGTHNVTIWRAGSGNVTTQQITVNTDPNENMRVFTYPNPSEIFKDITVHLNYTHPSGYDGGLYVSETSNPNDGLLWLVFESGTVNATYIYPDIEETRSYYFILAAKNPSNGNYMIVPDGIHTHYVKGINVWASLQVKHDFLQLDNGVATQYYTFTNPYVGSDVVILDDGNFIAQVGNYGYGEGQPFEVSTIGEHNLTMVLRDCCGGSDKTVAYVHFFVSPEEEPTEGILPGLDEKVGALLGTIITIVFILLPILLVGGFGLDIDLHPIVYVMTGSLGIVFSIFLGFFPIWVAIFILVVAVIILFIAYWRNM